MGPTGNATNSMNKGPRLRDGNGARLQGIRPDPLLLGVNLVVARPSKGLVWVSKR